jgi:hypothetical protein
MKKILILFFLTSCVSSNTFNKPDGSKLNFTDDLSFNEFNQLLIEYAENSSYPNIN